MTSPAATPDVQDLGELEGPLLVFGGIDGNLDALEALLKVAAEQGVPFTRMLHTGSVAPFCAEPAACTARLADLGIPSVKGAFELDASRLLRDGGPSEDLGDMITPGWQRLLDEGMPDELVTWMESLPAELVFTSGGRTFRLVHGAVSSIEKLLFWSSPAPAFLSEFELSGTDVVIAGRSGLPFSRVFAVKDLPTRLWHNPGSLGLPPNDGTPLVWYAVVRPTPAGIEFEHRPLPYDHRGAALRLRRLSPNDEFARCLESGLWPSLEDVPRGERSRRGQPIEPHTVTLAFAGEAETLD